MTVDGSLGTLITIWLRHRRDCPVANPGGLLDDKVTALSYETDWCRERGDGEDE